MISADSVSCAAAIEAPRLAWTRRQGGQVEVGGDRLHAEQQRQQHDHGGRGHGPARRTKRLRGRLAGPLPRLAACGRSGSWYARSHATRRRAGVRGRAKPRALPRWRRAHRAECRPRIVVLRHSGAPCGGWRPWRHAAPGRCRVGGASPARSGGLGRALRASAASAARRSACRRAPTSNAVRLYGTRAWQRIGRRVGGRSNCEVDPGVRGAYTTRQRGRIRRPRRPARQPRQLGAPAARRGRLSGTSRARPLRRRADRPPEPVACRHRRRAAAARAPGRLVLFQEGGLRGASVRIVGPDGKLTHGPLGELGPLGPDRLGCRDRRASAPSRGSTAPAIEVRPPGVATEFATAELAPPVAWPGRPTWCPAAPAATSARSPAPCGALRGPRLGDGRTAAQMTPARFGGAQFAGEQRRRAAFAVASGSARERRAVRGA